MNHFKCKDCGHEWNSKYWTDNKCPVCSSKKHEYNYVVDAVVDIPDIPLDDNAEYIQCICNKCGRQSKRNTEYIGVAECHACGSKLSRAK